jgi:chromosomal replication initiator protein
MEVPAHLELTPAWREFRDELRRAAGRDIYDIWLDPLEPQGWDGELLLLHAPAATQAWVAGRFGRLIQRCAQTAFGAAATVAFADPAGKPGRPLEGPAPPGKRRGREDADPHPQDRFIPRCTFDQFIIGDGNRLAHAAALAVAEAPGQAYNPLFLYAPPGLGKTHLLHAIANYITAFEPATTVRYTTVEAFTNGFISALNTKGLERFKQRYREVDVLLIDDVQFLASKAKTEEEFFHTFNALYDAGRQLVVTCDRLPRHLLGIEQRLRERFEAGLVAQLAPPDRATRAAILRKRAALDGVAIADDAVLDAIAGRVTDNVRALEGALIRIVAVHSLTGRALDVALAREVLDDIRPASDSPAAAITIELIQAEVAEHFAVTVQELVSSSRAARFAWPRQIAIQLVRDLTHTPLTAIGEAFGGRNHATVLHACKRVSERVAASPEDAADLAQIAGRLARNGVDRSC